MTYSSQTFYSADLEDRQESVERFDFKCECEACVNDYCRFIKPSDVKIFHLSSLSVADAIKKLKENNDFIKSNISKHPCFDTVFRIQENFVLMTITAFHATWLPIKNNS